MAGYANYSMSNNAKIAYENGEMPISKWTKAMIIEKLEKCFGKETADLAKKHTVSFLRNHFLSFSSWHHTSKFYNKTEFYEFADFLDTDEVLKILSSVEQKPQPAVENIWQPCNAFWTEWTGSRRHPHGTTVSAFGRTDGKKFISADGSTTKKVYGSYFHYCILSDKQAKEIFKKEFALKTSHRYGKWLKTGGLEPRKENGNSSRKNNSRKEMAICN